MIYVITISITPKSKDTDYALFHKYSNTATRTTVEGCKNYIDNFVSKHRREIFKVTGRKNNFFYAFAIIGKKFNRSKNTGKIAYRVAKEIKL